jgi:hypothetical protein
MTSLPMTHDAPRSINSAIRIGNKSAGGWLHAAMADPNLFIIVAFCVVGLLVTVNVIFRFPSFGPSVEQIAQILG